jgi:hypothetical protein
VPEELIPIVALIAIATVFILGPIARAYARKLEREGSSSNASGDVEERLARIEHTVESIAIEVERISEGQRFTTKLLSEQPRGDRLPAGARREG